MKSIVDPGTSIQELKQWIPEAEAGKTSLLLIEDLKQEIQTMEKLAEKYEGKVKRLKSHVYAIDLPDKEKFIYVIINPIQIEDAYAISISVPVDSPQEVIFQGKLSDLLR